MYERTVVILNYHNNVFIPKKEGNVYIVVMLYLVYRAVESGFEEYDIDRSSFRCT